ncbi:DUF2513 domain-containing protein [Janthinobacterium sp. B9-8]|uniref:DUF2513 domain-containing protein n=1 Tax=Janthinobacterium sp. B9-8 TaxID=1236179 RepID=UPI00061D397F|nr:DUF2513 domain-containing protein [Janthinobacterium sp. B9-8]AMC35308.1 hypothetical protein VN23_12160 [Janthinobacterium sp. B9-8]
MSPNIEYISKLLDVFINSPKAHISIQDIQNAGITISNQSGLDDEFLFHLQLALENELISNRDLQFSGLKSIGIRIGGGGSVTLTSIPIRLTQRGHDFAKSLQNKEILLKLKTELKDAPFKTIFDGSQKLLEHYLKKRLDALIE